MQHQSLPRRLLALFVTVALVLQGVMPGVALAEQRVVEVDNHTQTSDQTTALSDLVIDGVDKPVAGTQLDLTATVTSAQDATWDIPVIWVRDDMHIDKHEAAEGHTYLPVLAFFVPQEYVLDGGAFTVTLSESLAQLFGTQEILSVYDASTGITYILPASLKNLFVRTAHETAAAAPKAANADVALANMPLDSASLRQYDEPLLGLGDGESPIDIFCAKSAREALTDEDLQWLIELILDYLQPQAVELLLDGFPAFRKAARNNEIGKEIGLYIYHLKGDDDGKYEHRAAPNALASVPHVPVRVNGELAYSYMIAVDIDNLLQRDEVGPMRNAQTGKYLLVREGYAMETFKNTIVHELFHALMIDYNRTGMSGSPNIADLECNNKGEYISKNAGHMVNMYHYPLWFIEGTATAVENAYQFHYDSFQMLRRQPGVNGAAGLGDLNPLFTQLDIFNNYYAGWNTENEFAYFDLGFAAGTDSDGMEVPTTNSRYVSGYLATLYLSELSARYLYEGESSVHTTNGVTTIDANMLRSGLNSLLEWMHEGSTLDELIGALSPKDKNGTPIYTDTKDFENKFIKGTVYEDGWLFDAESLDFVEKFLNYMLYLDNQLPEGEHTNGSILYDFDERYTSPLDEGKKSQSEYLQVINSNCMVPSTVKSDTSNIGGGTSKPTEEVKAATSPQQEPNDELPIAAKTKKAKEGTKKKSIKVTPDATADKGAEPELEPEPVNEQTADEEPQAEAADVEEAAPNVQVADACADEPAVEPTAPEAADTDPADPEPVVTEELVANEEPVATEEFTAEPVPDAA